MAECSDCREATTELCRCFGTASSEQPAVSRLHALLRNSGLVLSGAAAMFLVVTVHTIPTATKDVPGTPAMRALADQAAAMRVLRPKTLSDVKFALVVWQMAAKENRDDPIAKKKVAELLAIRARLEREAPRR